jgi:hypothetical protein
VNLPGGGEPPPGGLAGLLGTVLWPLPETGHRAIMAYLDLVGDGDTHRQRGRPAIRLPLRDRQAGIAPLPAAASTDEFRGSGAATEGVE